MAHRPFRFRYVFTKLFVIAAVFSLLFVVVVVDSRATEKLIGGGDEIARALRFIHGYGGRFAIGALLFLIAAPFYLWWWLTWPTQDDL